MQAGTQDKFTVQAQPVGQSLLLRHCTSHSVTLPGHDWTLHTAAPPTVVKQKHVLPKLEQLGEPPQVPPVPQVGVQVHVATLYARPVPQLGAAPL